MIAGKSWSWAGGKGLSKKPCNSNWTWGSALSGSRVVPGPGRSPGLPEDPGSTGGREKTRGPREYPRTPSVPVGFWAEVGDLSKKPHEAN